MEHPIVHAPAGDIRGFLRDGAASFWGVPYAEPPVGERRFLPPEPMKAWDGVFDALQHGPIAPQGPSDLEATMGSFRREWSEDCLTLTINAPLSPEGAMPDPDAKLPVAVWFHGGANISGAGSLDWYDGAPLAKRGRMIVVGVNFRLAALGFLWHPAVNTKNLSILDQIEALRWVQRNIAAFGGDPAKVTVFGQSAGGNAIVHMTAMPETAGLYRSIILESPSIGRGNHLEADAARIAECLMKHLGIDPAADDAAARLRAVPAQAMLEASDRCTAELGREFGGMLFKPVCDAWHTPAAAAEAAAKEAAKRGLRVVIGTTADEMLAFVRPKSEAEAQAIRRAQAERYDRPDDLFARLAAEGGCDVWKYRFDWRAPDSVFGACHTVELPFVFGTLDAWTDSPMLAGATREAMEKLADEMQKHWCRFIAEGRFDEAEWPRFSPANPIHKIFDNVENGTLRLLPDAEGLKEEKEARK